MRGFPLAKEQAPTVVILPLTDIQSRSRCRRSLTYLGFRVNTYISAINRSGRVSPAFVTATAAKQRLVTDNTVVNEYMEKRTFRMDHLSDLAPVLRRDDCMFKADTQEAYYNLRLGKSVNPTWISAYVEWCTFLLA
jgi:hypothetical protein